MRNNILMEGALLMKPCPPLVRGQVRQQVQEGRGRETVLAKKLRDSEEQAARLERVS